MKTYVITILTFLECESGSDQFYADPTNRCSYYQCVHNTAYGPLPCAPGTMVPYDYNGVDNPCSAFARRESDCYHKKGNSNFINFIIFYMNYFYLIEKIKILDMFC